jgi:polyisoprenoid-binding protein YceI
LPTHRLWHQTSSGTRLGVGRHPQIRFQARSLTRTGDGYVVDGALHVGERSIELALPVEVNPGQRVSLTAHTMLDRNALGLEPTHSG